jgi:hypothetical protein
MGEILGLIVANGLLLLAGAGVLVGLRVVPLRPWDLLAAAGLALITGIAVVMLVLIVLLVLGLNARFALGAGVSVLIAAAGFAVAVRDERGRRGDPADTAIENDDARADDEAVAPRGALAAGPAPATNGADVAGVDGDAAGDAPPPPARPARPPVVRRVLAGANRVMGRDVDTILIRTVAAGVALLVAVYLVRLWWAYTDSPVANFDEFAIWSKKALALYYLDGLDPLFFANAAYNPIHLEYPLLLPLLEAFIFRAIGEPASGMGHGELLILFVAFVWAVAYLVGRERRNLLFLPVLLALAVSPFVQQQQPSGLGDITTACFAALGMLCFAQWLERDEGDEHRGRGGRLIGAPLLGAIFLAAASSTKIEGLMLSIIAFAVLGGAVLLSRRADRLASIVIAGVLFCVLVLPWRIWVSAHPAIDTFFDFGKALNPSYLYHTASRVPIAWHQLEPQLADAKGLMFLFAAAIAMAVVAIVMNVDRRLALFYTLTVAGVLAGIIWIFWVDPATWSPNRVISIPAMVEIVGLLHLGARASALGAVAADVEDATAIAGEPDEPVTARLADPAMPAR